MSSTHLLPLIDQNAKTAKTQRPERAIFKLFSPGLKSQRDEWVYALSREALATKMQFLIANYEAARTKQRKVSDTTIKWDAELERYRKANIKKIFDSKMIVDALYRPFCRRLLYFDRHFIGRQYQMPAMFCDGRADNLAIAFSDRGSRAPFSVMASQHFPELHLCASTDGFQVLPRYRYMAPSTTHMTTSPTGHLINFRNTTTPIAVAEKSRSLKMRSFITFMARYTIRFIGRSTGLI